MVRPSSDLLVCNCQYICHSDSDYMLSDENCLYGVVDKQTDLMAPNNSDDQGLCLLE